MIPDLRRLTADRPAKPLYRSSDHSGFNMLTIGYRVFALFVPIPRT